MAIRVWSRRVRVRGDDGSGDRAGGDGRDPGRAARSGGGARDRHRSRDRLPADSDALGIQRTEALVAAAFGPEFTQAERRWVGCRPVSASFGARGAPSRPLRACTALFGSGSRRWHALVYLSAPVREDPTVPYDLRSWGPFALAPARCPDPQRDRRPWSMTALRVTQWSGDDCPTVAQDVGCLRIVRRFRDRSRLPGRFVVRMPNATLEPAVRRFDCRTTGAARRPLVACVNGVGYRYEFRFRRVARR